MTKWFCNNNLNNIIITHQKWSFLQSTFQTFLHPRGQKKMKAKMNQMAKLLGSWFMKRFVMHNVGVRVVDGEWGGPGANQPFIVSRANPFPLFGGGVGIPNLSLKHVVMVSERILQKAFIFISWIFVYIQELVGYAPWKLNPGCRVWITWSHLINYERNLREDAQKNNWI